MINSLEADLR